MESFADRLRAQIERSGMLQKEVAYEAGIKKRALDMYLGSQASMPPADVAVRIAKVLNVTVEYLVTGSDAPAGQDKKNFDKLEKDLQKLSPSVADSLQNLVRALAKEASS